MPVPEERGILESLNTIRLLVESTCDDKWDVLIETALPAAGQALYILLIPDPGEILENYLQPRPRRGDAKRARSGSGRRQLTRYGALRWWQRISIPDIDNIIARHLPGRGIFAGRQAGIAERTIWQGIDILDRALWWWLVLDLSGTFVVEWASGIMESRFCSSPFDTAFHAQATRPPTGPAFNVYDLPTEVTVEINRGWTVRSFGLIERGSEPFNVNGQFMYTCTGQLESDTPGDYEVFARMIVEGTGEPQGNVDGPKETFSVPGPFTISHAISATELTRVRLQIIGTTTAGAFRAVNVHTTIDFLSEAPKPTS